MLNIEKRHNCPSFSGNHLLGVARNASCDQSLPTRRQISAHTTLWRGELLPFCLWPRHTLPYNSPCAAQPTMLTHPCFTDLNLLFATGRPNVPSSTQPPDFPSPSCTQVGRLLLCLLFPCLPPTAANSEYSVLPNPASPAHQSQPSPRSWQSPQHRAALEASLLDR